MDLLSNTNVNQNNNQNNNMTIWKTIDEDFI